MHGIFATNQPAHRSCAFPIPNPPTEGVWTSKHNSSFDTFLSCLQAAVCDVPDGISIPTSKRERATRRKNCYLGSKTSDISCLPPPYCPPSTIVLCTTQWLLDSSVAGRSSLSLLPPLSVSSFSSVALPHTRFLACVRPCPETTSSITAQELLQARRRRKPIWPRCVFPISYLSSLSFLIL